MDARARPDRFYRTWVGVNSGSMGADLTPNDNFGNLPGLNFTAEARFTTPDLAEVVALRDDIKANLAIRRSSQNRRKASLTASNDALKALYDCIRAAGTVILIKHFDRTIHQDMT